MIKGNGIKEGNFCGKKAVVILVLLTLLCLFLQYAPGNLCESFTYVKVFGSENTAGEYLRGEVNNGADAALCGSVREIASREDYRVLDDYYEEIEEVASLYPEITRLHIIGESYWGLPIYALELADNPGERDGRPETYHEALMHATEWPSGEIAMELIWYLAQNYDQDPRVTELLDTTRVFISPVINPDGFLFHTETNTRWRKNRSPNPDGSVGTDLNRNFTYLYGGRGSPDPGDWRAYWGSGPYSEPETQAMGDFTLSRDFITFLNGHTYLELFWVYSPDEDDRFAYEDLYEKTTYWNGYGHRGLFDDRTPDMGGGGIVTFAYGLTRSIAVTFEYQKISQPHYTEGFSSPGLETDAFGMIEGHLIWPSMGTSDHHVTHPASGMLIDAGIGETMPEAVEDNIALIMRSDEISHADQVDNAVNAGAAGVVLYNDTPHWMRGPLVPDQPAIGVMAIRGMDGEMLAEHLALGNDISVSIVPDQFNQDTFRQLWERNFEAVMIMLEEASEYSSIVEGKVVDRVSGEPVTAKLEKSVDVKAPFAGIFEGGYMMHERRTFIDAEGDYQWHMLPSKQPYLDTPPYMFEASAPGYHKQITYLEIDQYREEHELDFYLQPVVEMSYPFNERQWPVNYVVPVHFAAVDCSGRTADAVDVNVVIEQDGTVLAAFDTDNGIEETGKGLFELDLNTWEYSLTAGRYDVIISYRSNGGDYVYQTSFELFEELWLEGKTLLTLPESGTLELQYEAVTFDQAGSPNVPGDLSWSLKDAPAGVSISPAGLLSVTTDAETARFTIEVEKGDLEGSLPVRLATGEQVTAITAAEEAITNLMPVVEPEDEADVAGARAAVEEVKAEGLDENWVENITFLIFAERKLEGYDYEQASIENLIQEAIAAIDNLPDPISIGDKDILEAAWAWVDRILSMGVSENSITNLDALIAASEEREGLITDYLELISAALDELPAELTLDDEDAVAAIRALIEDGVKMSIDEALMADFLEEVEQAEAAIEALYQEGFLRQSLFVLGDPGPENRNSSWLTNFGDEDRWRSDYTDRSVAGKTFEPLRFFSVSYANIVDNPRWMQFDISERSYDYLEGYVGISDNNSYTTYPLDFVIFGDGEPLFEARLEHGAPAFFYRLDVSDVTWLRFEWTAESGSDGGFANRIVLVEPVFLIQIDAEILEAIDEAVTAIAELPELISLLDEPLIQSAREKVDAALEIGVDEEQITNLPALEAAEEELESLYQQTFQRQSMFELGDPGEENYSHIWIISYDDDNRWRSDYTDRTVAGETFEPLHFYSTSHINLHLNPHFVQYDIGEQPFNYVEGYIGGSDQSSWNSHHLIFTIYGDGEPLFEALIRRYDPAHFYRLDVSDVNMLRFEWRAEDTVSDGGYAARIMFMEPMFLIPRTEEAIADAEDAIAALPEPEDITIMHRDEVAAARQLVNNALAIGVQPEDITNLDLLIAAEAALEGLEDLSSAIAAAEEAIAELTEVFTLLDESAVKAARALVQAAMELGAEEGDIGNLQLLESAEDLIEGLYREYFERESLFVLGDPGEENYVDMDSFVDYENSEYWRLDRTIAGVSFTPLKIYSVSSRMDTMGTPGNPRWIEYDISEKSYAYVEGYVGIADQSSQTDYPLEFLILVDDEPAFEALLEHGKDARFYRLDLYGAERIKFMFWADQVSDTGYANRPAIIEPQFLIPQIDDAVAGAQEAISALPEEITPLDKEAVENARRLVDNALAIGVQPAEIDNLDILISAESDLDDWSALEGTVDYAVAVAEASIDRLPAEITLEAKWDVFKARKLVDDALRLGALPMFMKNIEDLEEAEEEIRQLIEKCFEKESLFDLTPVDWLDGALNEMSERFAAYDDPDSWAVGRTVFNRDFGSLKVYNRGHRDLDQQEQWIEYDISEKSYQYIEGYIGIWDESSAASFPPRFIIFGEIDGEMEELFSVQELWRGEPAYHYFLDISNVDKLRFYMDAEVVSGNRWTNRMAIVEPQFYTPLDFAGIYGDVNEDGLINVDDVIMVMQSVLGLIQLDEAQRQAADVNGDATINVDDVILIMQRVLGLITQFPVEDNV